MFKKVTRKKKCTELINLIESCTLLSISYDLNHFDSIWLRKLITLECYYGQLVINCWLSAAMGVMFTQIVTFEDVNKMEMNNIEKKNEDV